MGLMEQALQDLRDQTAYCVEPPFPRKIHLEPTGKCNIDCLFCHHHGSEYRQGGDARFIPVKLASKILSDAYGQGARELGLCFRGEALLHRELESIISNARDIGYEYIFLSTNGILADEKRVRSLIKNGLHSLAFSINAGNVADYKKIHGCDAYDLVMRNLRASVKIRDELDGLASGKASPFRLMVSYIMMDESKDGVDDFRKALSLMRLDDVRIAKKDSVLEFRQENLCWRPFADCVITEDGLLTFCASDSDMHLVVADLRETEIGEAWRGEVMKGFRKRMLEGDLRGTLCGKCLYGYPDELVPLLAKK